MQQVNNMYTIYNFDYISQEKNLMISSFELFNLGLAKTNF